MPDIAPDATPILPAHIADTVQAIARLHAEHERRASGVQRLMSRLTSAVARPSFLFSLMLFIVAWSASNLVLRLLHHAQFDPPPYSWLQGLLTVAAVALTSIILTTQRRADVLASHREQLTLELAILSEQKAAKIIQLLEEQRRDNPNLPDRFDAAAQAMTMPADPEAVLEAILESHAMSEAADVPE